MGLERLHDTIGRPRQQFRTGSLREQNVTRLPKRRFGDHGRWQQRVSSHKLLVHFSDTQIPVRVLVQVPGREFGFE